MCLSESFHTIVQRNVVGILSGILKKAERIHMVSHPSKEGEHPRFLDVHVGKQ